MTLHHNTRHRRGFTLVELLTVVGIIALLIGILIPSLSKARGQAKRVKTSALISAVEKGLEMFQNDFNQYPDSSSAYGNDERYDPVNNWPDVSGNRRLYGAHWLARAMAGPDLQGIDAKGYSMMRKERIKGSGSLGSAKVEVVDSGGTGATLEQFASLDRKGMYLEGANFLKDTDPKFIQQGNPPQTGRHVIADTYNFPVIYYRANPRARKGFSRENDDSGTSVGGAPGIGIYNHEDNVGITGTDSPNSGWTFAAGIQTHDLGKFGPDRYDTTGDDIHTAWKNSFIDVLHNEAVHEMSVGSTNQIKPQNPETFVLISPGEDGIYGTQDDVNNLRTGK